MVLECVPSQLAEMISGAVGVPTIGIGAGPHCDGQVLVVNDLLGMFEKFIPSFVKTYTNLAPIMKESIALYNREVREGSFPDAAHSFSAQIDLQAIVRDD